MAQITFFEQEPKPEETTRIRERTEFDLEMMRELGYCSVIENCPRYLDGRTANERPYYLLDYSPRIIS